MQISIKSIDLLPQNKIRARQKLRIWCGSHFAGIYDGSISAVMHYRCPRCGKQVSVSTNLPQETAHA